MLERTKFKKQKYLTVIGLFFILLGCVGAYFFVYQGLKPKLLQLNVFTVYSQYLKAKYFTLINNNQGDELAFLCYAIGWLTLLYAKTKSFFSLKFALIIFYTLGYLLTHGLAILSFTFLFLLILPLIFVLPTQKMK